MGREGQWVNQPATQPIDVAKWKGDDEFEIYPEGKRDKSLLISPQQSGYDFLIPNHRYLFKRSFNRHPDQFWTEIIAYRVGCMLEIPVPPAFVAFDSNNGICGALIEWFLNYPGEPKEEFVPGSDIMANIITHFDRKKGKQHNFVSIKKHFTALEKVGNHVSNWLDYWCNMLLFDALIGNTDRHQDNWGLLRNPQQQQNFARMAPVFDNGTSLGYEILEKNMVNFNANRLQAYINKGKHHLRWRLKDEEQSQHIELLLKLLTQHPELKSIMQNKLALFQMERLQEMMGQCAKYPITIPLSQNRARFICGLLSTRHQLISERINIRI